jgi:hypothetical protein
MKLVKKHLQKYHIKPSTIAICTIYLLISLLFPLINTPATQKTENASYQVIYGSQIQITPEEEVVVQSDGEFLDIKTLNIKEPTQENESIYEVSARKDIDFTTFDASYNKLVYNAQV